MSENGPIERVVFWLIDKTKYFNPEWWIREWAAGGFTAEDEALNDYDQEHGN